MRYNVKAIREERNVTQIELAQKSGVSRATIWMLENGKAENTTTKTLTNIASALGCEVDDLIRAKD